MCNISETKNCMFAVTKTEKCCHTSVQVHVYSLLEFTTY